MRNGSWLPSVRSDRLWDGRCILLLADVALRLAVLTLLLMVFMNVCGRRRLGERRRRAFQCHLIMRDL